MFFSFKQARTNDRSNHDPLIGSHMTRYSRQRIDDNPPDNNRQATPQHRNDDNNHTTPPERQIQTQTQTQPTRQSPSPAQARVHFFQVAGGLSRYTWTTYFCTDRATRQSTWGTRAVSTEREPTEQVIMVIVNWKRKRESTRDREKEREREKRKEKEEKKKKGEEEKWR